MSIKDRLKSAYENVALNGDSTWTDSNNRFQKANQKLYSKECYFNSIKITEERPRTVRDSIPNSKLAKYGDYKYNEARELCYTPTIHKAKFEFLSRQLENQMATEPWAQPEVDNLFIWILYCQNTTRFDYGPFEAFDQNKNSFSNSNIIQLISVESPLLNTSGFQEKKLKMSIISDKVKLIWTTISNGNYYVLTENKKLNIHRLPGNNFLISNHFEEDHDEFNESLLDTTTGDFKHIKNLSHSFKEQNAWIAKCTTKCCDEIVLPISSVSNKTDTMVPFTSKRLYSAVLQGLSKERKTPQFVLLPSGQSIKDAIPKPVESIISLVPAVLESTSTSVTVLNPQVPFIPPDNITPLKKILMKQEFTKFQKTTTVKAFQKIKSEVPLSAPTIATNKIFATIGPANSYTEDNNQLVTNKSIPPVSTFNPQIQSTSHPFTNTNNNYNYHFNSHYSNTFQNNCSCANYTHTHVISNRNLQTYQRQNTFFPNQYQYTPPMVVLQQNRTSMYPLTAPVQQSYFYQSLPQTRAMQRWIVPQNNNYPRTIPQPNYPAQISTQYMPQPPAHWISQNQQMGAANQQNYPLDKTRSKGVKKITLPQISILKKRTPEEVPKPSGSSEKKDFSLPVLRSESKDFDDVVSKTVNILFDDDTHVPVTSTISEELEIQAIEQYCNSNDNVYQELERQAAEQYDEYSENCKSPPNLEVFIGGLGYHMDVIVIN